jgi:sigma-E factor negative regulatory protein RseA
MSESKSEIISSLVDNYRIDASSVGSYQNSEGMFDEHSLDNLSAELSLEELASQNELSETWDRYHLIGDVMRDDIPQALQLDLSAQIASAIESEPTVLAPPKVSKSASASVKTTNQKVGQVNKGFKAKVVQLIKPLGQIAIAASAAGIMLLGVQQNTANNDGPNSGQVIPSQVVQTVPLAGYANPVSFNYQQPASRQSQKQAYVEQQRRFQSLLSDHHQQLKLTVVKPEAKVSDADDATNAVHLDANQ